MSKPKGSLCLVLHGHLPYVLNHGTWPHGEVWLFEAAVETYLPLLDLMDEVVCHGVPPNITIGLTPVLLEQLSHPRFVAGFKAYLHEQSGRAVTDARDFDRANDDHSAMLARRWERFYRRGLEHFHRLNENIPAEFARLARAGQIQILTSHATHAYTPLLLDDRSIAAQLKAGVHTTRKHLNLTPTGVWLPECAYRPASPYWTPPVLGLPGRARQGTEQFLTDLGLDHFFVDTHMLHGAVALGSVDASGAFTPVDASGSSGMPRGLVDAFGPVGVVSRSVAPNVYAFVRHPRVSEPVWSGVVGYPGHGAYLEFHRKRGPQGLRYWRVTDNQSDLHVKQPYIPEDAAALARAHAEHFCMVVEQTLEEHHRATGRAGVVVAAFDAELFGHWWAEGVSFLRDVMLTFHEDNGGVTMLTTARALEQRTGAVEPCASPKESFTRPMDSSTRPNESSTRVLRLPDGSWGERGDHRVWLNDQTQWMWEVEYRAETRWLDVLEHARWRDDPTLQTMLKRAARELLLLQASDWPFVVHSRGAVDYGMQRFALHATRFDRAMQVVTDHQAGRKPTPLQQVQMDEIDGHDSIFTDLSLDWWT